MYKYYSIDDHAVHAAPLDNTMDVHSHNCCKKCNGTIDPTSTWEQRIINYSHLHVRITLLEETL
jgi:hypothetical protein